MNIVFRVDASIKIGSGHVMRCLTLAKELKKNKHNVEFICRSAMGSMEAYIANEGFKVSILPFISDEVWKWTTENWRIDVEETKDCLCNKKIDLLIIDHYKIDIKWEKCISEIVSNIMVIDDLANRKHFCQILLDHNIYNNAEKRYEKLVLTETQIFTGPRYALLRDEFFSRNLSPSSIAEKNILITFGGSDPTNETLKVLKILEPLSIDYNFNVVVGYSNNKANEIKSYIEKKDNINFLFNISNMAETISRSSFVIGAGGVSSLERVVLKKPALVIAVAENQIEIAENLHNLGAVKYLGLYSDDYEMKLLYWVKNLINDQEKLNKMINNNEKIIGKSYTTLNVVKLIEELQ